MKSKSKTGEGEEETSTKTKPADLHCRRAEDGRSVKDRTTSFLPKDGLTASSGLVSCVVCVSAHTLGVGAVICSALVRCVCCFVDLLIGVRTRVSTGALELIFYLLSVLSRSTAAYQL